VFWKNKGQQVSHFEPFDPSGLQCSRHRTLSYAPVGICKGNEEESKPTMVETQWIMPVATSKGIGPSDRNHKPKQKRVESAIEKEEWAKHYSKLLKFREKTGHCRIPFPYAEDEELGLWASTLRQMKLSKNIDKRSEQMLQEIGFQWTFSKAQEDWDKMCSLLYRFSKQHGHFDYTSTDSRLVASVLTVRKKVASGSLSADRYERLLQIGVKWQELDKFWFRKLESLKILIHKKRAGFKVPENHSSSIGTWVKVQKLLVRYDSLSLARRKALRGIGLVVEPKDILSKVPNVEQTGANLKAAVMAWNPFKIEQTGACARAAVMAWNPDAKMKSVRPGTTHIKATSTPATVEATGNNLKTATLPGEPNARESKKSQQRAALFDVTNQGGNRATQFEFGSNTNRKRLLKTGNELGIKARKFVL
jgi:hypothetical protein